MNLDARLLEARLSGPPPIAPRPAASPTTQPSRPTFAEHLKSARAEYKQPVTLSGHAVTRALDRNILLDDGQMRRLEDAVDSASVKGSRTALVLLDDLALVVGVPQRKVITLVDRSGMQDNVFTAIDSAVVA